MMLPDVNSKTIPMTVCFSLKIMNARRKHFSSVREKSCHPEFHIQQNCVSEMKVKFSDEGNLRNLLSADLL